MQPCTVKWPVNDVCQEIAARGQKISMLSACGTESNYVQQEKDKKYSTFRIFAEISWEPDRVKERKAKSSARKNSVIAFSFLPWGGCSWMLSARPDGQTFVSGTQLLRGGASTCGHWSWTKRPANERSIERSLNPVLLKVS